MYQKANMINNIILILVLMSLPFFGFAQDPHQKKAKTIEEIIETNDPNKFKSLKNKDNFLVVEKPRNGNRVRFYIGDTFRFKTKDGVLYQEEINKISDSTFTIVYFDQVSRHVTYDEFKLDQIAKYYKRPVRKGLNWGLSWASFGAFMPLLYDWVRFKIPPLENREALIGIPAIQAGLIVIGNRDKYFNGKKFNENRKLRIFKSF